MLYYLKALAKILLPEECLICKQNVIDCGLCGECWAQCRMMNEPACIRCYKQLPYVIDNYLCGKCSKTKYYVDKIRSPMAYDDFSKKLIMPFKNFCNIRCAQIVAKLITNTILDLKIDYITEVPLHFYRLVQRGYNQSELLGRYVANHLGTEYVPELLYRNRFTKSQAQFSAKERSKNIMNAFSLHNNLNLKNKNILLIDDVYTTGSTLEECAKILKKNGANYVYAATGAIRC